MVLGGFVGVPGVVCEVEGLGVIPGTVPDPLLTAEQGGRLPGFCAPGVDPEFVEPGVVAPGVVVAGVVGVPGCVVPGVEVDGLLGLCAPAGLPGELELCATANAATPKTQPRNMLEKTWLLLITLSISLLRMAKTLWLPTMWANPV
jgi:hypothetical protein